jgi:hypothetical protein
MRRRPRKAKRPRARRRKAKRPKQKPQGRKAKRARRKPRATRAKQKLRPLPRARRPPLRAPMAAVVRLRPVPEPPRVRRLRTGTATAG